MRLAAAANDHDVRLLAGLERSDLVVEAECAGTVDRRHLEDPLGRQDPAADGGVDQGGELHGLEHVLSVVRRCAVGG